MILRSGSSVTVTMTSTGSPPKAACPATVHRTVHPAWFKDIIADRHYGAVADLSISVSQDFILFQFQGISWTTGPDGLAYAYRLKGYENQWNYTHDRQVEYRDLGLGDYYFEVCAIDRDLNYSAPLRVDLRVEPDPHVEVLAAVTSALGEEFVGSSASLRHIQNQLAEVAPTEVTVMLFGETGTGKGLAALTLHRISGRSAGPFIQVNCGAIPHDLVESELFGHEKGAFTGAMSRRLGKVELAKGGTLFLDEIGDLAADSQVKLLRLLEEQIFERVGGSQTQKADLRVVAATNRDLRQMVANGQFREDLYFRLGAFVIHLPPLRQRRDDIAKLALYFLEGMAAHLQKPVKALSTEALEYLRSFDWPGNVRELQHVIQRAVIICRSNEIQVGDLAIESGVIIPSAPIELGSMEAMERRYIQAALEKVGWVIGGKQGAAALLEMHESTLRSRMKKLGIERHYPSIFRVQLRYLGVLSTHIKITS
jgi:DNA-binding NtrC family response regulator